MGLAGGCVIIPNGYPWIVSFFLLMILFVLARHHVGTRYNTALTVAEDPLLVYWAHSDDPDQDITVEKIQDCKFITLHLRNGTKLEVDIPQQTMPDLIAWLRKKNPSIKLGAYDS